MKKALIGLAAMALLAGGTPVFAMDNAELHKQLQLLIKQNKQLTERIQKLENQVAKQERTSLAATATGEDDQDSNFLKTLAGRVELSSLVEVETHITNDDINQEDSSDISLATVEIGLDAKISEWSSGHILLLYEDDDDGSGDFSVDEGTITLGNLEECPFYMTAGKMYLPFGSFESNMIADPLTLEIAETSDSAVKIGFEAGGFYGSVYGFNGDLEETGEENKIDTYGTNIGYGMENDHMAFDVGVDWMNNIADSDGLGDHLQGREVDDPEEIVDYVDGFSVHAMLQIDSFSLIGEYIATLDDFSETEVAWKNNGAKPVAYTIEAAVSTELFNRQTNFAVGFQATDEAVDLGLVEELYIGAVSMEIFPHTNLAFEYSVGHDYSSKDGGTDDDIRSATMQLAVEF